MAADGDFGAVTPSKPSRLRSVGPSSNTGQKGNLTAPLIDFCTVTFHSEKARKLFRPMNAKQILDYVFMPGASIAAGPLMEKTWNFVYTRNAVLVDETGSVCGRVGISDDGNVCVSLTGQGCQHVPNWRYVHQVCTDLTAKLSRLDIAVDDLTGDTFDVHHFLRLYQQGEFVMNGRPPEGRFVDDLGNQKGCSLYIGKKGHKELNVYEKGKQLGDPESNHTRCELRLYAARTELPLDALIDPGKYFGGAYPMLAAYVIGEAERLHARDRMVNASAKAMVKFLRNQAGTALNLAMDALGEEVCLALLKQHVLRPGRPGRMKSVTGDLKAQVREQLLGMGINQKAA
ncbi:replication protein [Lysobacter maris]|uniref:Replication protein n=1 Tax=Marilutibacter maris TaxID=1605891 RepID=A0A508ASS4_9GAMM|nr:replication initiation factor domain-containing protein [Lysobacter maris]KAB8191348.1 replication protein [Lysobacter maris]